MKDTNKVYLSLGSNENNRLKNLQNAIVEISNSTGEISQVSSIYETKSWGYEGKDYYNMCISVNSKLSSEELIIELLSIEKKLGRKRGESNTYTDRNIDLDILFYGNKIVNSENLIIPHPRILDRNFVLMPLAEIAPDYIHPQHKISIKECLALCKDDGEITQIKAKIKMPI